jgi:MerR family transcriptional regulator, light-induced transcriptional regulator
VSIPEGSPVLRIGELSRRLGVSDHVLRAWESRYGLLQPTRSPGGFRLYSEADVARVRRMQALAAQGLSAAEAARVALAEDQAALARDAEPRTDLSRGAGPGRLSAADARRRLAADPGLPPAGDDLPPAGDSLPAAGDSSPAAGDWPGALQRALDAFDEPAAQAVFDRMMSDLSLTAMLREVVLPYLAELGERWARGTASIAQEHFASNVIQGRLAGLARGWGDGHGPRAILACPSAELHDLALMIFGIVLNRRGWRIDYLGANTPVDELTRAAQARQPDLVVLAATRPETLAPFTAELIALARHTPLVLAGPGATPQLAAAVHAQLLTGDPVTAADNIGWPR